MIKILIGYDESYGEDYSCEVYMIRIFGKHYVLFQRLFKNKIKGEKIKWHTK